MIEPSLSDYRDVRIMSYNVSVNSYNQIKAGLQPQEWKEYVPREGWKYHRCDPTSVDVLNFQLKQVTDLFKNILTNGVIFEDLKNSVYNIEISLPNYYEELATERALPQSFEKLVNRLEGRLNTLHIIFVIMLTQDLQKQASQKSLNSNRTKLAIDTNMK